jgi:hypothetical protein
MADLYCGVAAIRDRFFFSLIFLLSLNIATINPRWHGFEAEDYEDDLTPSARYDRLGIGRP